MPRADNGLLVGCLGCLGIIIIIGAVDILAVAAIRYVAWAFFHFPLMFWPTFIALMLAGWLVSALRGNGRSA